MLPLPKWSKVHTEKSCQMFCYHNSNRETCANLCDMSSFICLGQLCSELELFNCPNNTCISEHLVCDGKSDCAGGNDELKDLCLMIGKPVSRRG